MRWVGIFNEVALASLRGNSDFIQIRITEGETHTVGEGGNFSPKIVSILS